MVSTCEHGVLSKEGIIADSIYFTTKDELTCMAQSLWAEPASTSLQPNHFFGSTHELHWEGSGYQK